MYLSKQNYDDSRSFLSLHFSRVNYLKNVTKFWIFESGHKTL